MSKHYIKYLFLLAPFLFSASIYVQISPSYASVLLAFKMVSFLYVLTDYLKSKKLSNFDFSLMVYFFVWFISTYLNGNNIVEYIKEIAVIISFAFMIENAFKRGDERYLIRALGQLLFIELVINLICMIIFPDGVWRTYSFDGDTVYSFLGLDNQITPIFIVAEFVFLIELYLNNFKVSFYSLCYAIVWLLNLFLTMSATGIIGCTLVLLVLVIGIRYRNLVNIKTTLIVVISAFLLIVLLRMQNIFGFIIEGVFKKDLTLTNRTEIWDRAIEMIKQKPLLGYGCGTLDKIVRDRNAHDFYLQILLQSGLIGLFIYVNIFYVALKYCWRDKDTVCSIIVASTLLGYMVCGISEVYSQSWLFIILSFAYCIKEISIEEKNIGMVASIY